MNNDGLYSASLVTTVTSACISVGFITILGFLFDFVALKLTEWEIPKTEAEFQNRLSIKVLIILFKIVRSQRFFQIFSFACVNYYSPIFYIAFFKNLGIGTPNRYRSVETDGRKIGWPGCDQSGKKLKKFKPFIL